MRALVLTDTGADRFPVAIVDRPTPTPGPTEVIVRVEACGLCHHDVLVMTGVLKRGVKAGVILGHEIAGRVVETGEGVTKVAPGDSVVSLPTNACGACPRCLEGHEHRCIHGQGIGHGVDGGFAEYVKLREGALVKVSPEIPAPTASLLACPMGVAHHALRDVARVRRGESVLVTGAGGGLGTHALQIVRAMRARPIALTSHESKVPFIADLGAEDIVVKGEVDFSEEVLALTGDQGASVVMDNVGSPLWPQTLRSLGQFGRLVCVGELGPEPVRVRLAELIFRDAALLGASGAGRANVEQCARWVEEGKLDGVVQHLWPLEQIPRALALVRSGSAFGRIVLTPR